MLRSIPPTAETRDHWQCAGPTGSPARFFPGHSDSPERLALGRTLRIHRDGFSKTHPVANKHNQECTAAQRDGSSEMWEQDRDNSNERRAAQMAGKRPCPTK